MLPHVGEHLGRGDDPHAVDCTDRDSRGRTTIAAMKAAARHGLDRPLAAGRHRPGEDASAPLGARESGLAARRVSAS